MCSSGSDVERAEGLMAGLSRTPRFHTALKFMSRKDKAGIQKLHHHHRLVESTQTHTHSLKHAAAVHTTFPTPVMATFFDNLHAAGASSATTLRKTFKV